MDKKVKSFADRFEEFIMARVEDISSLGVDIKTLKEVK